MVALPAGIFDEEIEIFGRDFKAYCFKNGKLLPFAKFPDQLLSALQLDLDARPKAKAGLISRGIPEDQHLEMHTFCMYAGFDNISDFNSVGALTGPEYHNHCGLRGKCKYEGDCCTGLPGGMLSKRELQVAELIGKCWSDKLIASELNISTETLRHHKNSIERKAGIHGKPAIAVLAYKLNAT